MFSNHLHQVKWPRLRFYKNGHRIIYDALFLFFSFSLFLFDPSDHGLGFCNLV
jgi:hypothetical protein